MSSYQNYLVTATLLFSLSGCTLASNKLEPKIIQKQEFTKVKTSEFELENHYIIFALEYENQNAFDDARHVYLSLFENTNRYEYLLRYLLISFNLKDYQSVKRNISKYLLSNIKEEEILLKLYSLSLLNLSEKQSALDYAKELISKYKNDLNYELLGSIYIELKDFRNGFLQFEKSFLLNDSENTLNTLSNIQYYYLLEKEETKKRLETFIEKNGYVFNICLQLLTFYEKDNQNEKLTPFLKKMYFNYEENKKYDLSLKTKSLLIKYLAKDNIEDAIKFLEVNSPEDVLLIALYQTSNKMDKAYALLNKLYLKTNNSDFLAQIAIMEFERAENKSLVINEVIIKLDKALKSIDNAVYDNYFAYLLIDYDKDIKKGLRLVKKALKVQPDNLAFIDTLAWGEFKLNNCLEAYTQMKRVVDKVGLDDEEIKLHWEKIKECKK